MIRTFIFSLLLVMAGAGGILVYENHGGPLPVGDVNPSPNELCDLNLEGDGWQASKAVATNNSTRLTCVDGNRTRNISVSYQNLTIVRANTNS